MTASTAVKAIDTPRTSGFKDAQAAGALEAIMATDTMTASKRDLANSAIKRLIAESIRRTTLWIAAIVAVVSAIRKIVS